MKMYYFLDKDKVRHGPFPFEELVAYDIQPNTLVWTKGMEKWQKAEDIPEIADFLPEFSEDEIYDDEADPESDACEDDTQASDISDASIPKAKNDLGKNSERKLRLKYVPWLTVGLLLVVVVGGIGLWLINDSKQAEIRDQYERQLSAEREKVAYEQTKAQEAAEAQEVAEEKMRETLKRNSDNGSQEQESGEEISGGWRIKDLSGETNIRNRPRGEICMKLKAYTQYAIFTDMSSNGWLRMSRCYNMKEGYWVEFHSSTTGEYWIAESILYKP